MQQPTRYYISKSGEEPMVRSVRVTQNAVTEQDQAESGAVLAADTQHQSDPREVRPSVKGLVQGALRKRMTLT